MAACLRSVMRPFLGMAAYTFGAALSALRIRALDHRAARARRDDADGGPVRLDRAARDRSRVPDAHARAVAGAVGHRLPLGGGDRRRQRPARPHAPGALRHQSRRLDGVLLLRAHRHRVFDLDDRQVRGVAVRHGAQRHPRPGAAHERARPQRVARALDHFRLCGVLGRRRGPAVRVLQQVHPSGVAVAHRVPRRRSSR